MALWSDYRGGIKMLDFSLSSEQLKLQQKAREFALNEILPLAAYYDEIDKTPLPVLKKAYDADLMNGDIPKAYGGNGFGLIEHVIVTEEFAAACPGLATSIFDNSLGLAPLLLSKNKKLKNKYFPEILKSFKLICFATSEPTMGSDVAGIRCLVKKDGDDYILNGTKYWVTNGGLADYMSIFATADPDSQHEGICAFIVEKHWPGVTVKPYKNLMGSRYSKTGDLILEDVRVPKENLVGEEFEGYKVLMCGMANALAQRDEDKKLLLAALGTVPDDGALSMAIGHLDNPAIKEEASFAAVAISEMIVEDEPEKVAEALEKVLQATENEDVTNRAEAALEKAKEAGKEQGE